MRTPVPLIGVRYRGDYLMDAKRLLVFLRRHRLAVQASVSATGSPQAAVVGFAVTDHFEIVFDTLESSRKARNLRQNSRLALVIGGSNDGDERTVQTKASRTSRQARS